LKDTGGKLHQTRKDWKSIVLLLGLFNTVREAE
jgi:hypothetical protein